VSGREPGPGAQRLGRTEPIDGADLGDQDGGDGGADPVDRLDRPVAQPYVASITTSGSGPASATAAAIANGSFATRVVESFSPAALMRTTTERRR